MAALETKARVPMQLLQDIWDPALNEAIPIPRNASTCWKAADNNNFEVLKCVRGHESPRDESIRAEAANEGCDRHIAVGASRRVPMG